MNDSHVETSPHPYRWAVLGGVWLAYSCFGMTTVTLAPLIGVIGADLGMNHAHMGTVLGAWQLVYIASAVPLGMLLDRIGPRRAILLSILIMAASGALRGVAVDHASLFLAVAVFGLGGPLMSIGAPKVISLWFEGKERGFAMGVYMTGPTLGGVLVLSLTNSVMMPALGGDWRAVMLTYAGFVAAVALAWLAITAHPACRAMESRLAAEPRQSQLRMFAELLRVPAVRVVLAMSIGIFFFSHGLNNWMPEILLSHGMAAATAGYWASIPAAVAIATSLTVPRLATPARRLWILLGLTLAGGAATLMLHGTEGPLLALGLILQGVARGGMMTVAILTLIEIPEVGSRRTGLAGGLFFSAAEVGGVLGPVSIGVLAEMTGTFTASLQMMTGVCVGLVVLLGVLKRVTR